MPLYTRNRPYLGSFSTFGDLLAAYPNGSSIAAIPEDSYAVVRQWGATFVPNRNRNQWRPEGVLTLVQEATPYVHSVLDTNQYVMKKVAVPAGLLEVGGELQWASSLYGDASANLKVARSGIHSSDVAIGATVIPNLIVAGGPSLNSASLRNGYLMGRAVMTSKAAPAFNTQLAAASVGNQSLFAPGTAVTGGTNSDSQTLYVIVTGQNNTVAGSSITAVDFYCTYRPPQEA